MQCISSYDANFPFGTTFLKFLLGSTARRGRASGYSTQEGIKYSYPQLPFPSQILPLVKDVLDIDFVLHLHVKGRIDLAKPKDITLQVTDKD